MFNQLPLTNLEKNLVIEKVLNKTRISHSYSQRGPDHSGSEQAAARGEHGGHFQHRDDRDSRAGGGRGRRLHRVPGHQASKLWQLRRLSNRGGFLANPWLCPTLVSQRWKTKQEQSDLRENIERLR